MSQDRDGKVTVQVAGDKMSAVVFITPPDGNGRAADVVDVKRALKEAGVAHGLANNERMQAFVDEGRLIPVDFLAASGEPPGAGTDAEFTLLWKQDDAARREDASGNVDLRELNIVKSVTKGEAVARLKQPTRGAEGVSVTGEKIPGEWGMNVAVKEGANVAVSEDGAEFVATMDGSPKFAGGVLSVDPVYVVSGDVDYSTGNINFSGALEIKGNIQDGFVVKADGNITVGQNVQAAEVISGGDVVVMGGIINRKEGVVSARGAVSAKFIENSVVEAELDVMAERGIINSVVRSNRCVICSSREGKIMGGDIMAFQEIRAKHLGTDKETLTVLRAGFKFDAYMKLAELEQFGEKLSNEIASIQKSLSTVKAGQSDAIVAMKKNLDKLQADKANVQHRIAALRSRFQVNPLATVKGEELINPGCMVYIGSSKEKVINPMRFATLSSDREGGIALSAFDEKTGAMKTTNVGTKEKKKTVLVVDDAKFMRTKLKSILENGNYKIVGEAEDGKEAVQLYAKHRPDVVTMDITMPNVDGITALKAIRKVNPEARVVMISALGQKEKVRDSIIAGASDFILKPFVPEKVIEIIDRIAGK